MQEPIDVIIPVGPHDNETVTASVRSVRTYVEGARTIFIVSREDPRIADTQFISEAVFPFDLDAVADMLGNRERAGWYLQQLIKLYFPLVRQDSLPRVLAVDADTIFLRSCKFTDGHRVVFNFGDEFHEPYFQHMARMHPALRKLFAYSGITHCMLFDRHWLADLMRGVEAHHQNRAPFWKIFLATVDPAHREHSGASEYEMYFNFCLGRYADQVVIKRFRWRNIARIEEVRPDLYDYVSLHWHSRQGPIDTAALISRMALSV